MDGKGKQMIQALIGPVANLAGAWLKGKADKQAAASQLKMVEAKSKAKILLSKETSTADWERIMAEGSQSSWKDEWLVGLFSIPLALSFCGGGPQHCFRWICCSGYHARLVSVYAWCNCSSFLWCTFSN